MRSCPQLSSGDCLATRTANSGGAAALTFRPCAGLGGFELHQMQLLRPGPVAVRALLAAVGLSVGLRAEARLPQGGKSHHRTLTLTATTAATARRTRRKPLLGGTSWRAAS